MTRVSNSELGLNFKINYSGTKINGCYQMNTYYNGDLIEAAFIDRTHIMLTKNNFVCEGTWSFTKENYYLKLEKDELFGKEGETFAFKTEIEY